MEPNKKPMSEEEAYKKALKRGTRYRLPTMNTAVIIAVVFLSAVIIASSAVILSRNGSGAGGVQDGGAVADTSEIAAETTAEEAPDTVLLKLSQDDVHRGELILVNSDHDYVFPETQGDVSVFDNKTASYKVGDKNITLSTDAIAPLNRLMDDFYAATGCHDVLVVSGYRTEEFQRQLYADRVASEGAEAAAKYVALAGQSEHHTGLAMDLSVYTDAGEGHTLRTYERCKWLVDNFENYGFILRYPEEKAQITGISYESWHYRYVGLPHSLIMKERDLCLEEYIELLANLEEGRALTWNGTESGEADIEDTDGVYAVYCVPAAEGECEIAVPEDREYTVSGNNAGGFIVTLEPAADEEGGYTNE